MKKVATIFTWIFMWLTIIGCLYGAIWGIAIYVINVSYDTQDSLAFLPFLILALLAVVFGILALVFGTLQIKSLAKNEKHVWIGVMNILFCGVVGGILYLGWDPSESEANPTRIIETRIANKQEQKQPEESAADQLLKLKDLKDMGAITEEEYEAKRAALMKKL